MMGRLKSDQGQLFYPFNLEDAVPEDHLVRKIDTALDQPAIGTIPKQKKVTTAALPKSKPKTIDIKRTAILDRSKATPSPVG